MGHQIVLENVVIDYPSLFVARLYKGNKRYQGTFLITKGSEEDQKIQEAIDNFLSAPGGAKLETQYHDGDKAFPGNPHYEGKMFIRSYKREDQGPPAVLSAANKPVTALESGLVYRGAITNAIVDAYVPKSPNDDKICWGLVAVQKCPQEGEPILGGADVDPTTLFKPLETGKATPPPFLGKQ